MELLEAFWRENSARASAGDVPKATEEDRNGASDGASATALAVRGGEARQDRHDDLWFELGRARGRAEVLERELERRERELAETRRTGSDIGLGALARKLGR